MLAWERLGSRWTQTLVQPRGTVFTGHVEASCAAPAGPSGHGIAQEARSMTMCAAHAKSCRRSPCALLPRSLEAGLRRFVRNPSYPRSIRPCSARWCRFHRAELALGSGISGRTGVLRLRAPPYGALFRAVLPRVGRLYVACVMSNFDHSRASRTRSFRWRPSRDLLRPL